MKRNSRVHSESVRVNKSRAESLRLECRPLVQCYEKNTRRPILNNESLLMIQNSVTL